MVKKQKVTDQPKKAISKKAKPKGGLADIDHFVKTVRKHNIDLSYLKP